MNKINLILDCDPGHDDAIAIVLAGNNPKINLLGITVVAGNQTIEKTVNNTLNVCQHLELDVPVYAGCSGPILREQEIAGDIHGESGLDGPVFEPLNIKAESDHAVNFMVKTILESDEPITVVTTGPTTNLAMAIRLEPKILSNIKEIVLMGGCYQLGNSTPAAEFNIYADPEAAHIVFTSGRPITMVGLDVTRKVLCYPSIVERMSKIDNKASSLFRDLMNFFNKTQKEVYGWEGGPLHDPLTIAYLLDPNVLTVKRMYTEIDICSSSSYGRTNCDFFGLSDKYANTDVAVDVDVDLFWRIIEEGIKRY